MVGFYLFVSVAVAFVAWMFFSVGRDHKKAQKDRQIQLEISAGQLATQMKRAGMDLQGLNGLYSRLGVPVHWVPLPSSTPESAAGVSIETHNADQVLLVQVTPTDKVEVVLYSAAGVATRRLIRDNGETFTLDTVSLKGTTESDIISGARLDGEQFVAALDQTFAVDQQSARAVGQDFCDPYISMYDEMLARSPLGSSTMH